jgi:hypothetical protein
MHALTRFKKLVHLSIITWQIMKVSKVKRVSTTCQGGTIKLVNYA